MMSAKPKEFLATTSLSRLALAVLFVGLCLLVPKPSLASDSLVRLSLLQDYEEASGVLTDYGRNLDEHFKYCCRAMEKRQKRPSEYIKFDEKTAWFVYVEIYRLELLKRDMEGDCKGFLGGVRDCKNEEILEEFASRDATFSSFPGWYGKYHGFFEARGNRAVLPYTNYLLGHDATLLQRTSELDVLLIGPMPEKPDELFYRMSNSRENRIYSD